MWKLINNANLDAYCTRFRRGAKQMAEGGGFTPPASGGSSGSGSGAAPASAPTPSSNSASTPPSSYAAGANLANVAAERANAQQDQYGQQQDSQGQQQQQGQPPADLLGLDQFLQGDPFEQVQQQEAEPVNYEEFVQHSGGQEAIQNAMALYDAFTGENFDSDSLLENIAQEMPERYAQMRESFLNRHGDEMAGNLLNAIMNSPQHRDAVLKQIGWNAQDYAAYKQLKDSGDLNQFLNPELRAAKDAASKAENERQQLQQQIRQGQIDQQVNQFGLEVGKPVSEIMNSIKLPDTQWGQSMRKSAGILINAQLQQDANFQKLSSQVKAHFARGEQGLAMNKLATLQALTRNAAISVMKVQAPMWKAYYAEQQARIASGQGNIEPGAKSGGNAGGVGSGKPSANPELYNKFAQAFADSRKNRGV